MKKLVIPETEVPSHIKEGYPLMILTNDGLRFIAAGSRIIYSKNRRVKVDPLDEVT